MIRRARTIAIGLAASFAALALPHSLSAKEVPPEALACGVNSAGDELRAEFAKAAPNFKDAPRPPRELIDQWTSVLTECMERYGIASEFREEFLTYSIAQILTGQIESLMGERGLDVEMYSDIADRLIAEGVSTDAPDNVGGRFVAMLDAQGHNGAAIEREHGTLLGGYLAMRITAFDALREMER